MLGRARAALAEGLMNQDTGNLPRRHHYVPASYLKGFTPSGHRADYVWVHDYEDMKSFRSKPNSIGHSRDLYRFRSNPETDMDMDIEEALAKVDADGARVIAEVEEVFGGPDTEDEAGDLDPADMVVLLHYVCIMYLRNPAFRRSIAALASNQASLLMRFESLKYAGPDEFRAELKRMGIELPEGLGAAEVLSHLQSPGFRVEIDDPDWLLLESFSAEEVILKLLGERQWTLWVTDEERGYFVTSDRPMVLMWDSPHPDGILPGFAHRDTHVIFPLTKRLLLYGSYKRDGSLLEATRELVGINNHVMVSTCDRFVYSAFESFPTRSGETERLEPTSDFSRERMW